MSDLVHRVGNWATAVAQLGIALTTPATAIEQRSLANRGWPAVWAHLNHRANFATACCEIGVRARLSMKTPNE